MGDPFSYRNNTPPRSEYSTFTRPSGKTIYNQRKDYSQTLLQSHSNFQHHVEHLLTVRLERDLRSVEDCLEQLKVLEAQGRVWGQDLILQVKDQQLVLRDVESKEELDSYPLGSVQGCSAALDTSSRYNSVLAISLQERSPPGTTVLLFQCEQMGAETLKGSLEKLVKQQKEEQRGQYGHRSSLDLSPIPPAPYMKGPSTTLERWAETSEPDFHELPPPRVPSSIYTSPDPRQMPSTNPLAKAMTEVERDLEVLSHVLTELDLFVMRLKSSSILSTTKKKKKKKKKLVEKTRAPFPEEDYRDFFQKVKYAFNLMGQTYRHTRELDTFKLLGVIFTQLSFVLDHCPYTSLAPTVETPLLVPEAVEMLENTLPQDDYSTWKALGMAWNVTRAEYPNGNLVPSYTPVFSDGWLPPPMRQFMVTDQTDDPNEAPRAPLATQARVLYEFQGRNPQELSIRMGDTLQVLDQRKKWWLVQDSRGQKGYVPNNVLEPLGQGHRLGDVVSQESPPNLLPSSSPAEVTAWLKDKGFSRITVRCLGVLTGQQLLQMSPADLRAVCPEEWRRVFFKLSSIRTSLGMGPND